VEGKMNVRAERKTIRFAIAFFGSVALIVTAAVGQTVKIEGLIKARNGDAMILQTADSPKVTVVLNDATKVGQVQGVLKARRKSMSMAALIPGLAVKVEGRYNDETQRGCPSFS
jgi:predicted TIM-barrel fold metal-dependent hydrolase